MSDELILCAALKYLFELHRVGLINPLKWEKLCACEISRKLDKSSLNYVQLQQVCHLFPTILVPFIITLLNFQLLVVGLCHIESL